MNIKAFFVDALSSALELGIGTPDDVLRHVTPDVLAAHLPRPLWARLLTACIGAPRVDARVVVETIGMANLCEHVPAQVIWGCIAEIGARSLGKSVERPVVLAPPPPPQERAGSGTGPVAAPVAIGPSIPAPAATPAADQPLADLITELEQEGSPEPRAGALRARPPATNRFRQSNTQSGRTPTLGSARRPQAVAATPAVARTATGPRRTGTEVSEPEPETNVESDWRQREIPVDESQLVDWQADAATNQAAVEVDDFTDLGRKR